MDPVAEVLKQIAEALGIAPESTLDDILAAIAGMRADSPAEAVARQKLTPSQLQICRDTRTTPSQFLAQLRRFGRA
jgi:hypothetical protein